jgi:hypothetical protein
LISIYIFVFFPLGFVENSIELDQFELRIVVEITEIEIAGITETAGTAGTEIETAGTVETARTAGTAKTGAGIEAVGALRLSCWGF